MFSALKTLYDIMRVLRPSHEERRMDEHKWMLENLSQHMAKERMLMSRALLPEDWTKLPEYDLKYLKEAHEEQMRADPEYAKEYKAELEIQRREREEFDAQLREAGAWPYSKRTER